MIPLPTRPIVSHAATYLGIAPRRRDQAGDQAIWMKTDGLLSGLLLLILWHLGYLSQLGEQLPLSTRMMEQGWVEKFKMRHLLEPHAARG
jgi:hypothetical protein